MTKLAIKCVARDKEAANLFSKRNDIDGVEYIFGSNSYFCVINDAIKDNSADFCLILHDDVILARGFNEIVQSLIARLNIDWPNWGVAGNAGISAYRFGKFGKNLARFLIDPHSGPNIKSADIVCSTIDGNVMLINTAQLRRKKTYLPEWPGFQLYDIVLCLETLKSGAAVLAVPELSCLHLSKGNQRQFNAAKESDTFKIYLNNTITTYAMQTLNGIVDRDTSRGFAHTGTLDPQISALQLSALGRATRNLDIVIRTQFRSVELLMRTINSAIQFKAYSEGSLNVRVILVTDRNTPSSFDTSWCDEVMNFDIPGGGDSRFKIIKNYVNQSPSDFCWFVDDDDWIFPNIAKELSLTLITCPANSLLFCTTQHFNETGVKPDGISHAEYDYTMGSAYSALMWSKSAGENNHTPFCGVIFPLSAIRRVMQDLRNDDITYYEDHYLIKSVILSEKYFPIIFDQLSVGISVRNNAALGLENTITERDRLKWDISQAQMYWVIANSHGGPYTLEFDAIDEIIGISDGNARGLRKSEKRSLLIRGILKIAIDPLKFLRNIEEISTSYSRGGIKGVKLYLRTKGSQR